MNLPNVLTLSRIGFAFILVYLLLLNSLLGNIWASIFFIIASLTDFYDGYLAKKRGLVSNFGKIMDPIADKVMMLSIFFALAFIGMVAWWMVIVMAIREVWVTMDRLWCMHRGQVIAAERAGKIKTVFQMATVSLILGYLVLDQAAFAHSWFHQIQKAYQGWINIFMIVTVAFTLGSAVAYFRNKMRNSSL